MQTVFSQRLLAELRTLHGEEKVHGDDTFQDLDDVINPNDSGPRLSVTLKEPVAEIYALVATQAEQISGRCPNTTDQLNAPGSPPIAIAEVASTPAVPDLLDPAVLRTMPAKVAAFMMYEPPVSPPWRAETASQQQDREELEGLGGWTGI